MQFTDTYPRDEFQDGKRVLVKFSGGTKPAQDVVIGPGTNASDLFNHLGLKGNEFLLSKGTTDTVFGADEALYPQISDGESLYATTSVEAGI